MYFCICIYSETRTYEYYIEVPIVLQWDSFSILRSEIFHYWDSIFAVNIFIIAQVSWALKFFTSDDMIPVCSCIAKQICLWFLFLSFSVS